MRSKNLKLIETKTKYGFLMRGMNYSIIKELYESFEIKELKADSLKFVLFFAVKTMKVLLFRKETTA